MRGKWTTQQPKEASSLLPKRYAEVARYNIRVNAVAPGVIESEMIHAVDKKHYWFYSR